MVLVVFALIPTALITDYVNGSKSTPAVSCIVCTRLCVVWPVMNMFAYMRKKAMNTVRIFEVIFLYYLMCHIAACLFIHVGTYPEELDIRDTWLRRLPVPQPGGIRETGNINDLSQSTIYIHALLFAVNSVSHIALGDIASCTLLERGYNIIMLVCMTFIYAYLLGSVVSMVAEFIPAYFI